VALGLALGLAACSKADAPPGPDAAPPRPAGAPLDGAALFNTHCARCHGASARGTPQGPPLVDPIYRPGHHPDASFYRAVAQGVRAHHWRFGDMPRVGGVTNAEVTAIIAYVRGLQEQAGIR